MIDISDAERDTMIQIAAAVYPTDFASAHQLLAKGWISIECPVKIRKATWSLTMRGRDVLKITAPA